MHIMWINEVADLTGGCERYIADTAGLLRKEGIENTFLYGVNGWTEPGFLQVFNHAFPMVDVARQIDEINPDVIYIHRLNGTKLLKEILKTGKPAIRFYHDHKPFCLREHKYTVIGHKTCTKPIGLHCYPCLGFINRKQGFPGITLASLPAFKKELKLNQKLSGHIVGSQYMKGHLVAHGFDQNSIYVNPLYSISEIKPIQQSRKDFLFAGQLVRGKGLDILLKAYAQLETEHKLIICGNGKQELEFKQLASSLGLDEKVIWTGKISKDNLDKYYASAFCFLMPSRVPETFGLSGLEAMSFGTPVIATRVGGMDEWLIDGKTGIFVPSNDVEALASAMNKLQQDESLTTTLAKNAQLNFIEKFNPKIHIVKLTEFFAANLKAAN